MAEKKITKKMVAAAILAYIEDNEIEGVIGNVDDTDITVDDATAYLNHEIELLSKKSSSVSKKKQEENQSIMAEILEQLNTVETATVSELVVMLGNQYSGPKITAMLRKMVEADTVTKTVDGKKSMYSAA